MEEDFFLKNMKGVKPFKNDTSIVKTKTTNKKNVKLDKKTNTKKEIETPEVDETPVVIEQTIETI